jgi:hypothetical protein
MTQSIPTAASAETTHAVATTGPSLTGRLAALGPTTIAVAAILTAVEWWAMRDPENSAGVAATVGALAMTAPLVIARRRPVVAVALLAVAAVANGLLFGDFIRCAGAFPAVVFAAFAVGAWSRERSRAWSPSIVGLALALGAVMAQYRWDPALHIGAEFLAFGPPLVVLAWVVGTGWDALMARRGRR